MEIKRTINLSEDELNILVRTTEILGNIDKAIWETKEADDMAPGVITILQTVSKQIKHIVTGE